jgi:hypothetical protein
MAQSRGVQQNRLLGAPQQSERERIFPHLQLVPMPLGKVVYEPDHRQRYAYFPLDCIVSLLHAM